ncbi:MAG TPA: pirin family protein [Ferrovibrio sp.]|uniref:pirin family protein n=1 Tax=Ferrovibrio sp. TaxID=1917215 RepID=UPI002ED4ADCD
MTPYMDRIDFAAGFHAMIIHRQIKQLHPALRDDIGDLQTRRPLPGPGIAHVGPFLFLNHHGPQVYPPHNRGLPFGPHPHRGFETVTFILEGELAHRDTAGHESIIRRGGVQWMTAGRGLIHAELSPEDFKRQGGALEILQLWVNLPAKLKMTAPRYIGLQADAIPVLPGEDGKARLQLIAGEWHGKHGPVPSLTGVFMAVIEAKAGAHLAFAGLEGRSIFLYVVRGAIRVGGQEAGGFDLVELSETGDALGIDASADSVLLFGHADPIDEPIVAHGPFVMNTWPEIEQAIRDYQAGRFEVPAA